MKSYAFYISALLLVGTQEVLQLLFLLPYMASLSSTLQAKGVYRLIAPILKLFSLLLYGLYFGKWFEIFAIMCLYEYLFLRFNVVTNIITTSFIFSLCLVNIIETANFYSLFIIIIFIAAKSYESAAWINQAYMYRSSTFLAGSLFFITADISFLMMTLGMMIVANRSFTRWDGVLLTLLPLTTFLCEVFYSSIFDHTEVLFLYAAVNLHWIIGFVQISIRGKKIITFMIAGDSGVGKDRLADRLKSIFPANAKPMKISGDDFHKWERGDINWSTHTHLNPQANHLFKQRRLYLSVINGQTVDHDAYNHSTGTFYEHRSALQTQFISLVGLHSFYLSTGTNNDDVIKIFMEVDEELRKQTKIVRDTQDRGRSLEYTLKVIEDRKRDYQSYVEPQKDDANLLFSIKQHEQTNVDKLDFNDMQLEVSTDIPIDLDYLAEIMTALGKPCHMLDLTKNRQTISFTAPINPSELRYILNQYSHMPEFDISTDEASDYTNIMALILVLCIRSKKLNLI